MGIFADLLEKPRQEAGGIFSNLIPKAEPPSLPKTKGGMFADLVQEIEQPEFVGPPKPEGYLPTVRNAPPKQPFGYQPSTLLSPPPEIAQEKFIEKSPYVKSGMPEIGKAIREMVAPTTPYTEKEAKKAFEQIPAALEHAGMQLVPSWIAGPVTGMKPSQWRAGLQADMEEQVTAGFAPALAKPLGETTQLAVEWGYLYPKLFAAVGKTGSAISKIPQVQKGTQYLKALGGMEKIAEKYPRLANVAKNTAKLFLKGYTVGAITELPGDVAEQLPAGDIIKHVNKKGLILGGFSALFGPLRELDVRNWTNEYRSSRIRANNQLFDDLLKQVDAMPNGPKKSAAYKSLSARKIRDLKTIDSEVAAKEAELRRMKGSKFYRETDEYVENPDRAAQRAIENLKVGLGKSEPFIQMPTTRAGEVLEAVKGTAKVPKAVRPQAAEELGLRPGKAVSAEKPPQAPEIKEVIPKIPPVGIAQEPRTAAEAVVTQPAVAPTQPAQPQPQETISEPEAEKPSAVEEVPPEAKRKDDPDKIREDLIKKFGEEKWDKVFYELAEGGENDRFNELDDQISEMEQEKGWGSEEVTNLRIEYEKIVGDELEKRYGATKPITKEVKPAEAKPEAKEPWEMNWEEWLDYKAKFYHGKNWKSNKAALSYREQLAKKPTKGKNKGISAGDELRMDNIQQALSEGKPVPREVLEEYPDDPVIKKALKKMEESEVKPKIAKEGKEAKYQITWYERSENKNIPGPIVHKETITVTKGGKKRATEYGRSIAKERGWRYMSADLVVSPEAKPVEEQPAAITKAEKDALRAKGYSVPEILNMTPEQARAKLKTEKPVGPIQASVGASKSPVLDAALQRAAKRTKPSYVSQKSGKWVISPKEPKYGDYYKISEGRQSFVKSKKVFSMESEAINAARYIAGGSRQSVYVWQSDKGFEISTEKPEKIEHVEIKPKGPGLTRAERAILGKQQSAEAEIAQEEKQKVGYKAGREEAVKEARNKFNEFLIAQKLTDKHRQDAADIVRQYVPKEMQYRYIKRILEAKTNKRLENISKAINLYLDKYEQAAAKRDFVNFIKESKSKYRRGEVPFGKLRSDVRDRLLKILEQYDTMKLSEAKKEKLQSRDEYIKRVAGSVADAFDSLEDMGLDILQMPNARTEELNRLRKTHIGELDTEQIKYIHSSLEHLIKIAERKGDIKERIRAEKVGKLVNTARQEVGIKSKEPGVSKEFTGILGIAPRVLSTAQATPHTLTGYMTGKENAATMELINKNLVSMTKDKHSKAKEFTLSYRQMLKDAGLKQADEKILNEKIEITYGGKTFDSDVDNLMGIYMDIRAEGNLRRVMKSGRIFYSYKRHPKHLFIQSRSKIYAGRPSLKELREIVDYVEVQHPVLKKMADVYYEHNFKVQTPAVNKTSMEYQNYEIARKKKYWHTQREMPIGVEGKRTDISVSIENQGRYLPITGGSQPFRNIPFRQGVISNIQANAAYASITIPMQDIKALISDKRWQDAVIKNGYQKELSVLVTMLRRTQGMITSQDFVDVLGAKVLNNFGKYALSLRLSGYGVQTASIPAAFEVIEPKYFIAPRSIANLPRVPINAVKEMMDLSPTLWMRWTARQFDYVIGGVAAQSAYSNLVWGDKAITEKFLNQYTWGDQKAIYQIYLAAQEKVAAETDLKRGTMEFKKKAVEITEDALETQPQWDIIYRNELTSSPNIILRGSLMFSSARNAQYNVLLRAINDYRKGRIGAGEAGKRVSGVVYANILVAVVKRLIKAGVKFGWLGLLFLRSDDEEKREKITIAAKKEIAKEPSRLAVNSALNFISLPAFGAIFQNIAYETVKRIKYPNMEHKLRDVRTGNVFADLSLDVTGLIADTGLLVKYVLTKEKFKSGPDKNKPKWKRTAKNVADQLAELISMRSGLPYSAPKGEVYYQVKSAESAIEKAMTKKDILSAIYSITNKDGSIRKGSEEKYKKLRAELVRRRKSGN
jgi:hypothetical protein